MGWLKILGRSIVKIDFKKIVSLLRGSRAMVSLFDHLHATVIFDDGVEMIYV